MEHERIETEEAPRAIGPYSQAITAGDWMFLSGQIGLDPSTGELVAGGIAAEVRQVLTNLGEVLRAGGLSFPDVVRTTVYLIDLADFAELNRLYAGRFEGARPARSTVQVAALPRGARVEIDAVAVRR